MTQRWHWPFNPLCIETPSPEASRFQRTGLLSILFALRLLFASTIFSITLSLSILFALRRPALMPLFSIYDTTFNPLCIETIHTLLSLLVILSSPFNPLCIETWYHIWDDEGTGDSFNPLCIETLHNPQHNSE